MNYRLQEKIDTYHAGRMTPEESAAFESEIAKDPSLVAESDFQKEIVDGLKAYRKSQLKARLDAVDIAPTWIEFAQQSTLMKSFGGVAIATMIGAGVYFYAEPDEKSAPTAEMNIEAPKEQLLAFDWNIVPASISEKREVDFTESSVILAVETTKSVVGQPLQEEEPVFFTPTFEAPNAGKVEAEEALETAALDELPVDNTPKSVEDAIDVDTEITESLDVKYKYYDGKLFLSGDFDRAPYEILEINSASGRRIYVKYLNKYYRVETTDKLSILPEVKDQAVIEELKLLRENK